MSTEPKASHVQLFSLTSTGRIHWRLLSGNNREMGRSVAGSADPESARLAVKQAQTALAEFEAKVRRVREHQWGWELLERGTPVISAGHLFDRMIRCEQGLAYFLDCFADAPVGAGLMVSGARRWRSGRS